MYCRRRTSTASTNTLTRCGSNADAKYAVTVPLLVPLLAPLLVPLPTRKYSSPGGVTTAAGSSATYSDPSLRVNTTLCQSVEPAWRKRTSSVDSQARSTVATRRSGCPGGASAGGTWRTRDRVPARAPVAARPGARRSPRTSMAMETFFVITTSPFEDEPQPAADARVDDRASLIRDA